MKKLRIALILPAVVMLAAWNCGGKNPEINVDCAIDFGEYGPCPELVEYDDAKLKQLVEDGLITEDENAGTITIDFLEPGPHHLSIRAKELCGKNPDGSFKFGPVGYQTHDWYQEDGDPPAFIEFAILPAEPGCPPSSTEGGD